MTILDSTIYGHKENIKVNKLPNGYRVIILDEVRYYEMLNSIHDCSEYQEKEGFQSTSERTKDLWVYLNDDPILDEYKKEN